MKLQMMKELLGEFDDFLRGWKTFISLVTILIALSVMPEGKAQYVVSISAAFFGLAARAAKRVSEGD